MSVRREVHECHVKKTGRCQLCCALLTLPKFPAPSTQARPSGWWQISTSPGEMAMEPADDGVSLALRTDGCQPPLLPVLLVLAMLQGKYGTHRRHANGTVCWVEAAHPRATVLTTWPAHPHCLRRPQPKCTGKHSNPSRESHLSMLPLLPFVLCACVCTGLTMPPPSLPLSAASCCRRLRSRRQQNATSATSRRTPATAPMTMPAMAPPLRPPLPLLPAAWPFTVIDPAAEAGSVLMMASGCPSSRVYTVAFRNLTPMGKPAAWVNALMPGAMVGHICTHNHHHICC